MQLISYERMLSFHLWKSVGDGFEMPLQIKQLFSMYMLSYHKLIRGNRLQKRQSIIKMTFKI